MADYGDRMRRRARFAQFGRAIFTLFMIAGLAFGAQRACNRHVPGRPPVSRRR
ncbi:MAG: hypothetical protein K1X94_00685 [Sandaracinaceae bacterium]|nr:hypothetical protein [Sandaracinaceae bacterium]